MIQTKRWSVIINHPLYTDRQRIISSYTLTRLIGEGAFELSKKSMVQSVLPVCLDHCPSWQGIKVSTEVEMDLIEEELLNIAHS